LTATETARVLDAYDFSPFHTVVDVGGGNGALLAAILRQQPAATAILTDLPHVVELAYSLLEEAGVAARCEVVGGIFLKRYLPAATFIFSSTSSTIGMRAIFHDIEELQSRHGVTFASLDHRPRAA
jgi:16S rRNA A1518/A1519 N6-dimethyltransferase RsmA/KsgA/DIM1 with predicted DNA glycosylase/AP lyase activity